MNLERATAMLAEAEAAIAAGLGGPYAEANLASLRVRVAALTPAAPASTPATNIAPPSPPIVPKPAGTREQRLTRLAQAMGASDAALAAAIAQGTTPDAFTLQLADQKIAARKAAEQAAKIDAAVERIVNA